MKIYHRGGLGLLALGALFFFAVFCHFGHAADSVSPLKATWSAELLRNTPLDQRIPELSLLEKKLSVTLLPKNGKLRPSVEIRGSFFREGWALYVGETRLIAPQFSGIQNFVLVAYLNGRTSEVVWTAKGPKGESLSEKIVLLAPEAQEFRISPQWGEASVSLGLASFHFFQTQLGSFDSKTALVGLHYETVKGSSRFGLASDLAASFLTMAAKPSGYAPQTIQASVDGTYRTKWTLSKGRIQPVFLLGAHYLTMLSNGFPFGFSNLAAIEVGARFTFESAMKNGWLAQFRYIPVGSPFSTSEAEVELLVGRTNILENFHCVETDLGYWNFAYRPNEPTVIHSRALYIRVGYSI